MEYAGFLITIAVIFTAQANGLRKVRGLRDLISRHDYNRMMIANIKQPYEIIYPQIMDNGHVSDLSTRKHKIRHHGTHEHIQQLTLQLVLDGHRHKFRLTRNEVLLSAGIVVKHYEENNQKVLTKNVEHCYYHGVMGRDEWSSMAVSTCDGIRGVIHIHNETYVIQPLVKDKEDAEHPHVIFKASTSHKAKCGNSQGLWTPFQELHKEELIKRTKFVNAQKNYHQMQDSSKKLLRIAMVLDKSMYMGMEFNQQHVIQYAIDVANIVDLYYRELGFEVALTYLEFWNLNDQFPVDGHYRALLGKFLHFRENSLPKENVFDVSFLVVGVELNDDQVGIAIPDSVCTDRALAVVKSGRPFEPQQTATILSHMTGHILGVRHDESGSCVCKDPFGCIMSGEVLGDGRHSRRFSTCSRSDVDVSLNMGMASCLWGAPQSSRDFKQVCGNNIVERGEECDCGTVEECLVKDPCCDPATCLLQPWAQCRSGPCCSNCLFMPETFMCRPRQSECDVPEFCDSRSGECPANTHIEDGHPCAQGKGYCMGGVCPTLQKQCQGIWGTGAKGGHDQCFQRFNPTGNFNGHCGKDRLTGSYAKCQHSDILCGLLHCEGGRTSPIYGSDKGFSTTNVNANNMEYECKTVHGPAMMDMPHMGMVQDGTKCGHNRVCLHNSCVQLRNVPAVTCPSTDMGLICSGHGVCAPSDLCFCEHGWEGVDCSIRSNITLLEDRQPVTDDLAPLTTPEVKVIALSEFEGTLIRSRIFHDVYTPATAPMTEDDDGTSPSLLIIVLGIVSTSLSLTMGVTFFCYRRRTPQKTLPSQEIGNKCAKQSRCKKPWKSMRKGDCSEEENEMGELPPPPVIVMNPKGCMPEKGILKNSGHNGSMDHRGSTDSNGDQDSVGLYMYDDEDDDADEVCNILDCDSMENLDQLQDSASFDFVIPPPPQPPPPQFPLPDYYPSPALFRKMNQFEPGYVPPYDTHYMLPTQVQLLPQNPTPTWRTALPPQTLSPPHSRIVRLRNLTDYMQQINGKATIDLSPSPDDPTNHQISPSTSTSEDMRSSETETDKMYNRTSHSDHSPTSVTSNSTHHTAGPSFGSLSQYILKRNDAENKANSPEEVSNYQDANDKQKSYLLSGSDPGPNSREQYLHHNDLNMGHRSRAFLKPNEDTSSFEMPPPMNPINIRNIFSKGYTPSSSASRDSNNTTINGDGSTFTNAGNSRSIYEKSSTNENEQDHERFSSDDVSDCYSRSESVSRSHSSSPPSYSAVIRTGPNQIQLVPAEKLLDDGREIEGIQRELNRLLENLPRINAGTFERSPLHSSTTPGTPHTGPLPVSRPLKDETFDLPGPPHTGPLPVSRPLKDETFDNGTPCIDRSLEEIPAHFSDRKSGWSSKAKRPVSVAVQGKAVDKCLEEMQSLANTERQ